MSISATSIKFSTALEINMLCLMRESSTKICADTWLCSLWEALLTKPLPALLIPRDCWVFPLFICLLPLADFFFLINSLNVAICRCLPSIRSGLEQPAEEIEFWQNWGRMELFLSYWNTICPSQLAIQNQGELVNEIIVVSSKWTEFQY